MAYTKNNWQTGDVITAEKLNHMEDGIANSGGLLVWIYGEGSNKVFDKTAREVFTALESGKNVTFIGESTNDDYETFFYTPIRAYNSDADNPGFLLLSFDVVGGNWEQLLFEFIDMDDYPTCGGIE